ncbi:MAG: substrate-binding domain-containing protein [Oscillospiraceae bacterium]|nr:substrate-binding domain-containing protein [Oscillospiraceae bacterium]MCL2277824.1 substrate-binding domain-containing protein [Oscillospiraceae bacterium]
MKKRKILGILLVVAMMVVMVAACAPAAPAPTPAPTPAPAADPAPPGEDPAPEPEDGMGPIVLLALNPVHDWHAAVYFFAREKANELDLDNKMGFYYLTSTDVADQSAQIDIALAMNPSLIVLLPHNAEVTPAADRIDESGVPWVLFDRWVYSPGWSAYLTGDNPEIGRRIARRTFELIGGSGTVAIQRAPETGAIDAHRWAGIQEVIPDFPDINIIHFTTTTFSLDDAMEQVEALLVANPVGTLDAIISINDVSSIGVLNAVREAGRLDDIQSISGSGGWQVWFRAIDDYADQIYLFTYTYHPSMVMQAIQYAYDIVMGRGAPRETIIPPNLVDRDNVAEWFNDDTPY